MRPAGECKSLPGTRERRESGEKRTAVGAPVRVRLSAVSPSPLSRVRPAAHAPGYFIFDAVKSRFIAAFKGYCTIKVALLSVSPGVRSQVGRAGREKNGKRVVDVVASEAGREKHDWLYDS